MVGGYQKNKHIGKVTGVPDFAFNMIFPCNTNTDVPVCYPSQHPYLWYDHYTCAGVTCNTRTCSAFYGTKFYGFNTTYTNITIEYTGYFLDEQTGNYTFTLEEIDDSAIVNIGNGKAFHCCSQNNTAIPDTNFSINAIKKWMGNTGIITGTVELIEGIYYPIKIVYSNAGSFVALYTTGPATSTTTISTQIAYTVGKDSTSTPASHPANTVSGGTTHPEMVKDSTTASSSVIQHVVIDLTTVSTSIIHSATDISEINVLPFNI